MKKLSSHQFHEQAGAVFTEVRNWQIPKHYGAVDRELSAAANTIALLDRSYLGKVKLSGSDAIEILNNISTNDMSNLIAGMFCDTVFCTPKGRIVDYCRVLHLPDGLLLISSYIDTEHLIDWLQRFIILEDATAVDVSSDFLWLTLLGPASLNFVSVLSGQNILRKDEVVWVEYNDISVPFLLNTNFYISAYNICLTREESKIILPWLKTKIGEFRGSLLGDDAFQIIRVESGMPDWGTELTEDYNPHEARLLNAVSFTKGCYTGQEVIARLDTYDKVQKYLMIIDLQEAVEQDPPLNIYLDEEKIGVLTSYVCNPVTGRQVGLGYIKKLYAVEDFSVKAEVQAGDKRVLAGLRIPPVI